MTARFANRREAGRRLAEQVLQALDPSGGQDTLVLGLAPGGVPVAAEIARALHAPLDVLVTATLAAPGNGTPIGAIARDEPPTVDQRLAYTLGVTEAQLATEVHRQRAEARNRERRYRQGRPATDPAGRTVVLVADGLTSGPTAKAAVRALRHRRPARLVVAVPVCDARAAADLRRDVDTLICLQQDRYVHAVGPWYQDFREVAEREVTRLLDQQAPTG
jgi:putative phosphoribosyl transferase